MRLYVFCMLGWSRYPIGTRGPATLPAATGLRVGTNLTASYRDAPCWIWPASRALAAAVLSWLTVMDLRRV